MVYIGVGQREVFIMDLIRFMTDLMNDFDFLNTVYEELCWLYTLTFDEGFTNHKYVILWCFVYNVLGNKHPSYSKNNIFNLLYQFKYQNK